MALSTRTATLNDPGVYEAATGKVYNPESSVRITHSVDSPNMVWLEITGPQGFAAVLLQPTEAEEVGISLVKASAIARTR